MQTEESAEHVEVRQFKIQYPASAYTFPSDARIHQVAFDDEYLHVDLIDGRRLSIPLWWIPTLHNAPREEMLKYEINRARTMIVWDPDKCAINDELRIAEYLEARTDLKTEGPDNTWGFCVQLQRSSTIHLEVCRCRYSPKPWEEIKVRVIAGD